MNRRIMTIDCFVPSAGQARQQQPPLGRCQTPSPLPPPSRTRKRPHEAKQTPAGLGDAPTKTPPQQSKGIVIQELAAQTPQTVASTFRAVLAWQPLFLLDGKPLPSTVSVRVWEKGEGGRIAQSLVHGLLLPEDVHTFKDGMDESPGRRL